MKTSKFKLKITCSDTKIIDGEDGTALVITQISVGKSTTEIHIPVIKTPEGEYILFKE